MVLQEQNPAFNISCGNAWSRHAHGLLNVHICMRVSVHHARTHVHVSMKTQSASNWIYKMHQWGINTLPWQHAALLLTTPFSSPPLHHFNLSPLYFNSPISFLLALSLPLIHLNISLILPPPISSRLSAHKTPTGQPGWGGKHHINRPCSVSSQKVAAILFLTGI